MEILSIPGNRQNRGALLIREKARPMENEALTECWLDQWEMKRIRYEYAAKERYLWFCRTHPGAADRMMNKHIASFLDMSPVSLSRIRKQLAQENVAE